MSLTFETTSDGRQYCKHCGAGNAAPKVKPLVFLNGFAESIIGYFELRNDAGEHWCVIENEPVADYRPYPDYIFKTAEEAEADAQAFYARKILSCLDL